MSGDEEPLRLFVHGARDPFGSLEELRTALGLIPAPTQLLSRRLLLLSS